MNKTKTSGWWWMVQESGLVEDPSISSEEAKNAWQQRIKGWKNSGKDQLQNKSQAEINAGEWTPSFYPQGRKEFGQCKHEEILKEGVATQN
jgi:hypothetical protein